MFLAFYSIILRFLKRLKDTFDSLPSICPICQFPQSTSLICHHCFSLLQRSEFVCFQCAEPLPESITHKSKLGTHKYYCGRCQTNPPWFDKVLTHLVYKEPLSNLIQQYKFSHKLYLLPSLTDCLIQQIQLVIDKGYQLPEAIIAVPLHPKRLQQRGFNQSLLIAERVSKHFNIPLLKHLIIKTKNTHEQASLSRKQRKKNIYQAFEIPTSQKTTLKLLTKIAIVDDVITSGNTCNEIARILKNSKITFVDIWCIAKTPLIK